MIQVYLGSLPIKAEFLYKDKAFKKVDKEHAIDFAGKKWVMEPHYGAVITLTQYEQFGLSKKDERQD